MVFQPYDHGYCINMLFVVFVEKEKRTFVGNVLEKESAVKVRRRNFDGLESVISNDAWGHQAREREARRAEQARRAIEVSGGGATQPTTLEAWQREIDAQQSNGRGMSRR